MNCANYESFDGNARIDLSSSLFGSQNILDRCAYLDLHSEDMEESNNSIYDN